MASYIGNASNNSTNCTPAGLTQGDVVHYVYKYTFIGILTVICLIGNSLVIVTLPRSRQFSRPSVYFIVSLACSDLMSGIVFPFYTISHMELDAIQKTLGNWNVCVMLVVGVTLPQMASAYNLVLITAARFIAVKWPLRVNSILTRTKCIVSIVLAWFLATIISFGSYFRQKPDDYCGVCRYEWLYSMHQIVVLLHLTVLLPLVIMIGLYCSIAYIIHSHARRIVDQNTPHYKSSVSEDKNSDVKKPVNEAEERMSDRFGRFSLPVRLYSKNNRGHNKEAEITVSTDTSSLPGPSKPLNTKGKLKRKKSRVSPRQDVYKVDVKVIEENVLEKQKSYDKMLSNVLNRRHSLKQKDISIIDRHSIRRTKSLSDLIKKDKSDETHCCHHTFTRESSSTKKTMKSGSVDASISKSNQQHSAERLRNRYIKQENRLLRVVVFLLGYFTIAWVPFIIWVFWKMGCGNECSVNRYIKASSRILLYSNSAINVFIYAGRHAGFRKALQQQLRHVCCLLRITCWTNYCCCQRRNK